MHEEGLGLRSRSRCQHPPQGPLVHQPLPLPQPRRCLRPSPGRIPRPQRATSYPYQSVDDPACDLFVGEAVERDSRSTGTFR